MFFDLLVSGFARVDCSLDRLGLGVVARLDIDLFAFATIHNVEEPIALTRFLFCNGAELVATFTRAQRIASNRGPTDYWCRPCRRKLCRVNSPT